jgi:hypothetical protein
MWKLHDGAGQVAGLARGVVDFIQTKRLLGKINTSAPIPKVSINIF